MTTKAFYNIRKTVVGVILGAFVAVVPFYFETKAMTEENRQINLSQDKDVTFLKESATELELQIALERTERIHNEETLERIEKKLDELIKEVKALN